MMCTFFAKLQAIYFDDGGNPNIYTLPKDDNGFMMLPSGYSVHPDKTVLDFDGVIIHIDPQNPNNGSTGENQDPDGNNGESSTRYQKEVISFLHFTHRSLEEAVSDASRIVLGKVVSIGEAQLDGEDVFKTVTFQIEENLYGGTSQIVKVLMYGGEYQGVQYTYYGAATYTIGQKQLLLLDPVMYSSAHSVASLSDNEENRLYEATSGVHTYDLTEQTFNDVAGTLNNYTAVDSNALIRIIRNLIKEK